MSNIILINVDAPKDADILSVDIYSDGKARCFSWSEKWVDVVVDNINPHTNADRIRAMTDEELAKFLFTYDFCKTPYSDDEQTVCYGKDCVECLSYWLKSPADKDGAE